MPQGASKPRKCQSERAHKPAPDTTSKILASLDETDFQKLLERSTDYSKQLVDGTSGFASFDASRVKSENSLTEEIYERERREIIDRDRAGDRQSSFIRHTSNVYAKPSPTDARAPVGVTLTGLDFIDDGMDFPNDVEMQEISPKQKFLNDIDMQEISPKQKFLNVNKGNIEEHPIEYTDECDQLNNNIDDRMFKAMKKQYSSDVYPPQHDNLPQNLVHNFPGTDERPTLSAKGPFNYLSNQSNFARQTQPPKQSYESFTQDLSITRNGYGTINTPSAPPPKFGFVNNGEDYYHNRIGNHNENRQMNVVATQKADRKKRKKAAEKGKSIDVKAISGYMGERPIEELLLEIEGSTVAGKEKKGGKQEDKRRKSKEVPKTSPNGDDKLRVKSPKQQVERNVSGNKENENIEITAKRIGTAQPPNGSGIIGNQNGKGSAVASSRASLEEDEFLSADEGTNESSALPFPYESVAETTAITSEVLLDGGNFLADDDDIILQIKKAEEREEEFIPVTKGKKIKDAKELNNNKRNGSVSSIQTNGVGNTKARNGSGSVHSHHTTPSLADYIEDAAKQAKVVIITTDCRPPTQISYADAAKRTADSTTSSGQGSPKESTATETTGVVASTSVLPVTAQKKDSRMGKGVKNAPTNQEKAIVPSNFFTLSKEIKQESVKDFTNKEETHVAPIIQKTRTHDEPFPVPTTPELESQVQVPPSSTLGLSFFYEDNTEKLQEPDIDDNQLQTEGGLLVLHLGDKTITLGQESLAQQSLDPRHIQLVELLASQWKRFQQQGAAPNYYTPRIQTN